MTIKVDEERQLVDAFLSASRALVAVAARSLAGCDGELTLPQYRVLVILCGRGPRRAAELAEALGVQPSTVTRMGDRLESKGLIRRSRDLPDRRVVMVTATAAGREVVAQVSRARRAELRRILGQMPDAGRPVLVEALRSFSKVAGEVPEEEWALGWGQ